MLEKNTEEWTFDEVMMNQNNTTADREKTATVFTDPFTISEDGHYVGFDGFIVPRTFEEFYSRPEFREYVKSYVSRQVAYRPDEERDDRENDLLAHLMELPENSKFIQPGYNGHPNGCPDRIATFDPVLAYGASRPRFLCWLNCLLFRQLSALRKRDASNPVCRFDTYAMSPRGVDADTAESVLFRIGFNSYDRTFHKNVEWHLLVGEFGDFVKLHNPELTPLLQFLSTLDNLVTAQRRMQYSVKSMSRARSRLRMLWRHFEAGTEPPKQRKVYEWRTPPMRGLQNAA